MRWRNCRKGGWTQINFKNECFPYQMGKYALNRFLAWVPGWPEKKKKTHHSINNDNNNNKRRKTNHMWSCHAIPIHHTYTISWQRNQFKIEIEIEIKWMTE